MRIDILSLFPDMFQATLGESIVGKAQDNGFLDIKVTDFRDYTDNKLHLLFFYTINLDVACALDLLSKLP